MLYSFVPQFHGEVLLAGLEGAGCSAWAFTTPSRAADVMSVPSLRCTDFGASSDGWSDKSRKPRGSKAKASKPKQQGRYPKRNTK